MKPLILFLAAVLAVALLIALGQQRAHAQQPVCLPRAIIAANLAALRGQTHRITRVIDEHTIAEVYTSESGEWTIVVTDPAGNSCLAAAGRGWREPDPGQEV